MKHNLFSQLILLPSILLCQNLSFAQSGWHWQNPLPQGNALRAVYFTDANNGTLVGEVVQSFTLPMAV